MCSNMLQNLANWPTEFGGICRGKLWSLPITILRPINFINNNNNNNNNNNRLGKMVVY